MPEMQELKLPEPFLLRMRQLLGEEYQAFLDSFRQPRTYGIRTNTLKIRPEELVKKLPLKLKPVAGVPGGFFYRIGNFDELSYRPGQDPLYRAGLFYLQEPSAMLPAAVLPVTPGDLVLDLCAAPGGKATAIAAKLEGKGLLLANEISASRVKALQKNLELFGISNACITNEVPAHMAGNFPAFFDKIIVDAPCSGEGMFRKDPGSARVWSEEKVLECAKIQKGLVTLASSMLRPGGWMVYSTCTFSPEEDEQVIWHLLQTCPEMEVCEIPMQEGFTPGQPDWLTFPHTAETASGPEEAEVLSRCVRIFPHRGFGEGHFLALLHKKESSPFAEKGFIPAMEEESTELIRNSRKKTRSGGGVSPITREEREAVEAFFADAEVPWDYTRIISRGGNLSLVPEVSFPREGIKITTAGLFLGEVRKGRFEPSQALAMALSKDSYPSVIDFDRDDPRLARYFRGETIDTSDRQPARSDGWQLICAEGWPVGWGKRTGTLLKNKLHPGWRS